MSRNFMNWEWEQEEARKEERREETKARTAEWMASLKREPVHISEPIAEAVDRRFTCALCGNHHHPLDTDLCQLPSDLCGMCGDDTHEGECKPNYAKCEQCGQWFPVEETHGCKHKAAA